MAVVAVVAVAACVARPDRGAALVPRLPAAGRRAGRVVVRSLAAAVALGAGVGAVLAVLVPGPAATLSALLPGPPWLGVLLVAAATAAWAAGAVFDGVVVALDRPWWATAHVAVLVAGRIALILAVGVLLGGPPSGGVVLPGGADHGWAGWMAAAWLAPVLLWMLPGSAAVAVLARRHGRRVETAAPPRVLGPMAVARLGATLLHQVAPLLVVLGLGPGPGMVFFVAWQVVTAVDLAAVWMLGRAGGTSRRRLLAAVGPALALVAAGAGPLLGVFGPDYAAAADVLRVLLLGAAFRLVVVHELGALEAAGRAWSSARLHLYTTVPTLLVVGLSVAAVAATGLVRYAVRDRGDRPAARGGRLRAGPGSVLRGRARAVPDLEPHPTGGAAVTTTGTRHPGEHPPGGAGSRAGAPAPSPEPAPAPPPRHRPEAETAVFANPEPGGSPEGAGSPTRYAEPATIVMPGLPVGPPGGGPAADPAPPSPQPGPPVARRRRWYSPALVLLALALLPVAAATTDLDALDGWGLATVLSPAAWAALACAVGACLAELWMPRPRVPMLATATGVLVLCSTGLPSVVEPVARFTTSYVIVGFVDAIAGDGVPPPDIDARFFWPAFFAQWAWFRDAAGAADLDVVLRWFPPVVVLVWAIGVYALARSMLGGTRAPWAAAWLFVGLNWIEQDYFSPQAIGIVLLLTVLTFALGPLATRRTDAAGVPGWPAPHPGAPRLRLLRRWAVAAMTPPNRPTLPPRQLLLIYFCAALCLIALAPEHQLTPFAIIGQLTLLAVVGRFRGRGLVLVAIFAVVGVRHHRRPRLLDEPDRAAARQRRRRQRPADRHRGPAGRRRRAGRREAAADRGARPDVAARDRRCLGVLAPPPRPRADLPGRGADGVRRGAELRR